jgi:hypothetical protein
MRKSIAAIIGAAATVALVGGAGLAAASASSASPAASGTEHFYLMTTQPSSSKYEVIATGVFTASGTDISGNTVDTVKLTGGGFKITHNGAFRIIKQSVNPKTCFAVFVAKASFTVGHGTGAYKGISGSGTATISDIAIGPKSKGKCNLNVNPIANEETITASPHVKL